MKNSKSQWFGFLALITLMVVSCEDTGVEPAANLSGNTQLKSTSFNLKDMRANLSSLGIGGAFSAAYAQSSSSNGNTSGRTGNSNSSNARQMGIACFTETFTENQDGSYEWRIEFTGNCEEDGELLSGVIRGVGKHTDNSFTDTLYYENFGGQSWTINGIEISEGLFQFEDDEDPLDDKEEWEEISSTYSFSAELQVEEQEENETYQFSLVTKGKERYNQNEFVIEEFSEKAVSTNGESYESMVTSPLVVDFSCEVSEEEEIPVSGIEESVWSFQGESEAEIIDYGDGSCDSMATVTVNDESREIDLLSEDEDEDEEEDESSDDDDDDDDDSDSSSDDDDDGDDDDDD